MWKHRQIVNHFNHKLSFEMLHSPLASATFNLYVVSGGSEDGAHICKELNSSLRQAMSDD